MTQPLQPPPKKNPQQRTVSPTRPPELRSRAALSLTAAAAEGRFALQRCTDCQTVQYPPRDACRTCMSTDLPWEDMPPEATLLAETTIHASPRLYFRERAPIRVGTVEMTDGTTLLAYLHGDVARLGKVHLTARLDAAGQGVLIALPAQPTDNMEDDPLMRALSADPKHRRCLITDARSPHAPALAKALLDAGASTIFAGEPEGWRPYPHKAKLQEIGVQLLPLDVTDTASVQTLAAELGGKTDILLNTAQVLRPGGVLERGDVAFAKDELEVNYLGLMRLAQSFGPAMCARTADSTNAAAAWVNFFWVGALSNAQPFGAFSASQAGAYSLTQSLRAEFRASGLRVMNVFHGPTESDDWFQPTPPPRVTSPALARATVSGLQGGLEDVYCGDVAKDLRERFRRDPKVLEREMTLAGDSP